MERSDVLAVVKGHMLDTMEDLEECDIEETVSMADLGANSLDMVEIVSCSMRELRVKVPRSRLAGLENIGQLVDLLVEVGEAKD